MINGSCILDVVVGDSLRAPSYLYLNFFLTASTLLFQQHEADRMVTESVTTEVSASLNGHCRTWLLLEQLNDRLVGWD